MSVVSVGNPLYSIFYLYSVVCYGFGQINLLLS